MSADRYCIGTGTGAGKDITIRYTLNDPARVAFAVERRARRSRGPVRCARSAVRRRRPFPVRFAASGLLAADPSGQNSRTVDRTGKVTPLTGQASSAGRVRVSRLLGEQAARPGLDPVLLQGVRADGSRSQARSVKFLVPGIEATDAASRNTGETQGRVFSGASSSC